MAHLVDSMAYLGQTPWHGLGNVLNGNETHAERMEKAGFNWHIKSTVARFPTPEGPMKFPGRNVLFRSDNFMPLEVVSDKYQIVQPREIMEFFETVVEAGYMTFDTVGSLDEGRKLWALVKMSEDLDIDGDKIGNYCLIVTSCDKSMATRVYYTSVRVVCNNTLQWSLQRDGQVTNGVTINHSTKFNAEDVRRQMGFEHLGQSIEAFETSVYEMAQTAVTDAQARDIFEALVTKHDKPQTDTVREDDSFEALLTGSAEKALQPRELTTYQSTAVENLMHLRDNSPGADMITAKGTGWGVVNAVTNWTDFHASSRNQGNRFKSAQFGPGAAMKAKAVDLVATMGSVSA